MSNLYYATKKGVGPYASDEHDARYFVVVIDKGGFAQGWRGSVTKEEIYKRLNVVIEKTTIHDCAVTHFSSTQERNRFVAETMKAGAGPFDVAYSVNPSSDTLVFNLLIGDKPPLLCEVLAYLDAPHSIVVLPNNANVLSGFMRHLKENETIGPAKSMDVAVALMNASAEELFPQGLPGQTITHAGPFSH